MSPTPILDPIAILRVALFAAIGPLLSGYQDSAGRAKCYWQRADQKDANGVSVTIPYVVCQSQDNGGQAVKHVGDWGWAGLVALKALANGQTPAEILYALAAPGMAQLAHVGYSISADFQQPLVIPPTPTDTWQSGGIWRVTIH